MKVETVIYLVETDASSNVSSIFSIKTLAQSISNSYNHIKEDLMLRLGVGFQNYVKDTKKISVFMILKAKDFYLGL